MTPTSLTPLEKTIGLSFRNKDLLKQSLTHRSAGRSGKSDNERLEFLGDAVLELAVTECLFNMSNKPEGELTNWRSALVKGKHLAKVAREIKIGDFLFMSRGEEKSGGRDKDSTLANALEALIGAMYLDQGWEKTRDFIDANILISLRDILAKGEDRDAQSIFQEIAQEKLGITPDYKVLSEAGPDHNKLFTVAVCIGKEKVATGTGSSKQRAEQEAAEEGLRKKGWKR